MNNKYLIISFIVFFISAFLIFSCKNEKDAITSPPESEPTVNPFYFDSLNVQEIKELLLGNWEWTHSVLMQRHIVTITPDSVGYTEQRLFEQNDTVSYFRDNILIGTHRYEIRKFKISDTDSSTLISIDSYVGQLYFLRRDEMMIGNGWEDGADSYFVRK
jgi:hypothetical protein